MMRRLVPMAVLALAAGMAWAAPERWQDLTAQQRAALAPLQGSWAGIDADRREKWLEVAARFPKLTEAERQRLQQRMVEWARRSPSERGQARLQYQEAQRWSPQERQERWEAYQSLDPQARQVLAERWKLEEAARRPQTQATLAKRNVVEAAPPVAAPRQAASPTSVRAREGATTKPIGQPRSEPPHHHPGLPKVAATPVFVDPATLLPRRGPQAAAIAARPASAPAGD
jgi:hypothetical protein